ncbi:hypothetical protein LSUE1_G008701 [Lachnellula suecica]|uniref:MARVEL domain-containing protein n=1 Tax=Lachnellula suecica TaxID=602035 RepID=A0A8T9BRV2_9HELO|nr:hypothetical protein LSUE1_G008701 [Lachnellula suecica]
MMELGVQHIQTGKLAVHVLQGALIFATFCLDIAVVRSSATVDGRWGWNFAACFITIPALVYLTMTPRFPRTRKLANPYAMAAVDGLFCIIWLSAFATVANWNSTGKCGDGCKVSKAVVGLGVFIWLFWVLTTFISLYSVVYYKREGYLPGASRAPTNAAMIDPDKEAFSTAPHDDEYAPVHHTDEEHEDIHNSVPQYGSQGSRYGGGEPQFGSQESHYGGAAESHYDGSYSGAGGYVPPTVHDEPTGYSGAGMGSLGSNSNGRAQFPSARYDNV